MGNRVLPKKDVENIVDEKKRHLELFKRINQQLTGLGIEYTNKMAGKLFNSSDYFSLRDSIQYRLKSMMFHLTQLLNINDLLREKVKSGKLNTADLNAIVNNNTDHLLALFDSIIFHTVSLFDYVGNLIGFICIGKNKIDLKWNGVINLADNKNHKFSKNDISKHLLEHHYKFVNNLYSHRSDIIHYKMDNSDAQISIINKLTELSYDVYAPEGFVSRFDELKTLGENYKLTLNYVAFWSINHTMEIVLSTINDLFHFIELNRVVPKGKEIFIIRTKPNS